MQPDDDRNIAQRHRFGATASDILTPRPEISIHVSSSMNPATLRALGELAAAGAEAIRRGAPTIEQSERGRLTGYPSPDMVAVLRNLVTGSPEGMDDPPQPCQDSPTGWCEFDGTEAAVDTDCIHCHRAYDLDQIEDDFPHKCGPGCVHAVADMREAARESDRRWLLLRNVILGAVLLGALAMFWGWWA